MTCLSFYPTKNLGACGDGGMLLTTREDVAAAGERASAITARRGSTSTWSWDSRAGSTISRRRSSASSSRRLGEWTAARRRVAARYRELLAGLPLELPVERPPACHVYHQFTLRVARRDEVARRLAELGIGTTVHYPITIPAQPLFCPPGGAAKVAADS